MRPDLLFHYTSAVGIKGIVESKAIFATDAEYLNDAQELAFGRDELFAALMERAEELYPEALPGDGSAVNSMASIMRGAAGQLKPGCNEYASRKSHYVYVACFCEAGDLLSQWRGYGAGGGFAIGFKPDALANAKINYQQVQLEQVQYGDAAKARMVKSVVAEIAPRPRVHPGAKGFFEAQRLLFPALATVKNDAFAEEREWRLLVAGTDGQKGLQFRTGSLGLIPYIELEFDNSAIAEVNVGPGEHQQLRKEAVERLLVMNGFEGVTVVTSSAPFRG